MTRPTLPTSLDPSQKLTWWTMLVQWLTRGGMAGYDVTAYGAVGDGSTDDTTAFQDALDAIVANGGGELIIPKGTYKITDTLHVGDGVERTGITVRGYGQPTLQWYGATSTDFVELISCLAVRLEGFTIDGRNTAGVIGIHHTVATSNSSQHTIYRQVWIKNCGGSGLKVNAWTETATLDYLKLDECQFANNGIGIQQEGGARQVLMHGGSVIDSTTYGLYLNTGKFTIYQAYFGINATCDIYLNGEIANIEIHGMCSESMKVLDGNWGSDAGWSRLLPPNVIIGLNQDSNPLAGDEADIDVAIDYDCYRPLVMIGCKLEGDVDVGSKVQNLQAIACDFYNYDRRAGQPNPIVGFIGTLSRVSQYGWTDMSAGTGTILGQLILGGGRFAVGSDSYLNGIDIRDTADTIFKRVGFCDAEPDTYYALAGWVYFNQNPGGDEPIGWRCLTSGNGSTETIKATWEPWYHNKSDKGMIIGNGNTSQGFIYLMEDSDFGTDYVALQAPSGNFSTAVVTIPAVTGTIALQSSVSGSLVLDDGSTEKITLTFTNGVLTARTVEATTSSVLANWTDA